jgi:hypothetical protein
VKTYVDVEVELDAFLTSLLEIARTSASRPGRFIPEESEDKPRFHFRQEQSVFPFPSAETSSGGSFPGIKPLEREADHVPPPLYFHSLYRRARCVRNQRDNFVFLPGCISMYLRAYCCIDLKPIAA